MNVLIVGSGGREHALAWKIARSPRLGTLYAWPGNPGIAQHAELARIDAAPDFAPLAAWCREHAIDLAIIGPERPLAEGMADALRAAGIGVFGPGREGARLESSKQFAKELMAEADIPTAQARLFDDEPTALAYLAEVGAPVDNRAAGLAEGKGVTVARTVEEAEAAIRHCMGGQAFGEAGARILVEQCLVGEEASLLAFTDGKVIRPMVSAQDHKPVFDGDEGPNTGGMGAYSPAAVLTPELYDECVERVLKPCLNALRARGIDYCGVIYAGLMITAEGPKVIEFNCRFGDPEVQAILPRLRTDLLEVMAACVEGRLGEVELEWGQDAAICVVAASGGYPGAYDKGKPIKGLDALPPNDDVVIFHAGTALNEKGDVVTAGGRVLGLTVRDEYLRVAYERAYDLIGKIKFEGMHYRSDIGRKAFDRIGAKPR